MDSEKPEKLSRSAIYRIAWEIRDGEASQKAARSLLEYFCNVVDDEESIPPELLRHLRDAFSAFLNGKKSIEAALGIARKTGRPKADPQIKKKMAGEILRLRLGGTSHQDALAAVSEQFGWGETIVAKAWKWHQPDALDLIRIERPRESYPWTPEEVARLNEIFSDRPWYLTPEKLKARGDTSEN